LAAQLCSLIGGGVIFAVEYTIERENTADGQPVVTETVKVTRKTYSQNWPAYNAAQTHEKSELQALLYELCQSIPEPQQQFGRPRLSLADIIFSSAFKVYSTVSGRRFMTDLREQRLGAIYRNCRTTIPSSVTLKRKR